MDGCLFFNGVRVWLVAAGRLDDLGGGTTTGVSSRMWQKMLSSLRQWSMTSPAMRWRRSSWEMAADRNDASLAPAESVVDVDVDDDVRRSSMLKPENSRPVRDKSFPCNTCG